MDADELLARTLQVCLHPPRHEPSCACTPNSTTACPALEQEEEAQHQQQQLTPKQREVLGIVQQNEFKARSVEDPVLMSRARALMPLADWRAAAQAEHDLNQQLSPGTPAAAVDDLVVKSMLRWFKQDFFSWVRGVRMCWRQHTTTGQRCHTHGRKHLTHA